MCGCSTSRSIRYFVVTFSTVETHLPTCSQEGTLNKDAALEAPIRNEKKPPRRVSQTTHSPTQTRDKM